MLDSLAVVNFKAFSHAVIPLAPYTLLTGLNSTGKSTVLQSLALLRQSYEVLTDDDDGGFLLNGDLVELGTGQDVLNENYTEAAGESGPRITLSLDSNGMPYTWSVAYERESDLLHSVDRPVGEIPTTLFGPGFQYLRADRITPAVTFPRSHDAAVRRGFLGARGEHTINYLRYHQDDPVEREQLWHPESKSRTLLAQAEAWMQDICPGVNLQADAVDGTDLVRLSYRFGRAGLSSSNRYRPTNVGFGLTYVLPVVVACLAARQGGLVMVENPEAHLHPRGQTAMAALTCAAASAGAQVIVETHSDHVLNGVRLAVKNGGISAANVLLHFFRRVDGHGMPEILTPTLGPDGMLSEWPDGFFDEWERALDRLLD